ACGNTVAPSCRRPCSASSNGMIGMPSRVRSTKYRWIALIRSACARAIAPAVRGDDAALRIAPEEVGLAGKGWARRAAARWCGKGETLAGAGGLGSIAPEGAGLAGKGWARRAAARWCGKGETLAGT